MIEIDLLERVFTIMEPCVYWDSDLFDYCDYKGSPFSVFVI